MGETFQQPATASGAADLIAAAQAVVDRWDTPLWKDVPATAEYIGRLRAALAAGQATAAQRGAYAAPPDERAAFEAQFPVPVGVHWDGIRYVIKYSHLGSYRCDRFVGQWDAWQARAARAPADSVQEEAARLDFLIEQRAYVVSDPDDRPGYWLHWARPDGSTWVQIDAHPTPRAAIDAARKQEANHDQ